MIIQTMYFKAFYKKQKEHNQLNGMFFFYPFLIPFVYRKDIIDDII